MHDQYRAKDEILHSLKMSKSAEEFYKNLNLEFSDHARLIEISSAIDPVLRHVNLGAGSVELKRGIRSYLEKLILLSPIIQVEDKIDLLYRIHRSYDMIFWKHDRFNADEREELQPAIFKIFQHCSNKLEKVSKCTAYMQVTALYILDGYDYSSFFKAHDKELIINFIMRDFRSERTARHLTEFEDRTSAEIINVIFHDLFRYLNYQKCSKLLKDYSSYSREYMFIYTAIVYNRVSILENMEREFHESKERLMSM